MSLANAERLSDSPYVELIMHGHTLSDGSSIRPATSNWHMVFMKHNGRVQSLAVGALTTAGTAHWGEGAEILWIRFKLGTFMPHMPVKKFLDEETPLPNASSKSFWLHSSSWQIPDFENADTFVERLVRDEVLVWDPVVSAVMQDQQHGMSPRTVRHRFLRATGLTQNHIFQVERAQQAAALLAQGVSILDTVYETGYFDQPHLTKALKQWVGHTPAQIIQMNQPDCHSVQDSDLAPEYNPTVLMETR